VYRWEEHSHLGGAHVGREQVLHVAEIAIVGPRELADDQISRAERLEAQFTQRGQRDGATARSPPSRENELLRAPDVRELQPTRLEFRVGGVERVSEVSRVDEFLNLGIILKEIDIFR